MDLMDFYEMMQKQEEVVSIIKQPLPNSKIKNNFLPLKKVIPKISEMTFVPISSNTKINLVSFVEHHLFLCIQKNKLIVKRIQFDFTFFINSSGKNLFR